MATLLIEVALKVCPSSDELIAGTAEYRSVTRDIIRNGEVNCTAILAV
ncbi:hypothetical protein [Phyllobacterium ifriqiyense]